MAGAHSTRSSLSPARRVASLDPSYQLTKCKLRKPTQIYSQPTQVSLLAQQGNMERIDLELSQYFVPQGGELPSDVMTELHSILRLHSLTPQDLFFKWESYSIKLGIDSTNLDLKTARYFKKDIQDALERETRGKMHPREKRGVGATPRSVKSGGDMFGMMEGVVDLTPRVPMSGVDANSVKRKNDFGTTSTKTLKPYRGSSPRGRRSANVGNGSLDFGTLQVPFTERQSSGEIVQSLNQDMDVPEPPSAPPLEPRVKLKANTDLNKFGYKTMAMKLSEASEILDDRIDGMLALVQDHYGFDDGAFGNPASQSPSEIIAVGRIASDASESKLNPASMVLETSRRTGAGLRVPLMLDRLLGYDFFPGRIVALRGTNPSGEYFSVSEVLDLPLLGVAASSLSDLDEIKQRTQRSSQDKEASARPLNIICSSGPYTADDNLEFKPLKALCDRAITTCADALILAGPLLDTEHPLVASGELPSLPSSLNIDADTATMKDIFRALIALPLQQLSQSVPGLSIIIVPSVRDVVNKHVSWPQDRMARKELGLPRQCTVVTNPVTLSLNEIVMAISTDDVLYEIKREQCVGGAQRDTTLNPLVRLCKHLIEQRHFFPVYPPSSRDNLPKRSAVGGVNVDGMASWDQRATGAMLDTSYLALGEWQNVRPDVLVTPSSLPQFANIVDSVVVVNPGSLSKKRNTGTFAQIYVRPVELTLIENGVSNGELQGNRAIGHKLFERARVDVIKI